MVRGFRHSYSSQYQETPQWPIQSLVPSYRVVASLSGKANVVWRIRFAEFVSPGRGFSKNQGKLPEIIARPPKGARDALCDFLHSLTKVVARLTRSRVAQRREAALGLSSIQKPCQRHSEININRTKAGQQAGCLWLRHPAPSEPGYPSIVATRRFQRDVTSHADVERKVRRAPPEETDCENPLDS